MLEPHPRHSCTLQTSIRSTLCARDAFCTTPPNCRDVTYAIEAPPTFEALVIRGDEFWQLFQSVMYEVQGTDDAHDACQMRVAGLSPQRGSTAPASARFHLPFQTSLASTPSSKDLHVKLNGVSVGTLIASLQ